MNQKAQRIAYQMLAIVLLGLMSFALASAGRPDRQPGSTQSNPNGTPNITILNINNFTSFFRADGQGNHQVDDQSGGRYPRGTATCIYEDGFVWGGKTYLDAAHTQPTSQLIRVGGQTYNQGTKAGKVVGTGSTATATPPGDPRSRIYRIRRDYFSMNSDELRQDAATLNLVLPADVTQGQMDDVKGQYATDWTNWPVDLGAPYIERNGVAGFQPPPAFGSAFTVDSLIAGGYDEPGIAGSDPNSPADQVIWTVYNDLDRSSTLNLYQSEPLGLEGQVTLWGYKRSDALGNLYFKKIRFINKGGVDIGGGVKGSFYIDSMYISQWSDPDEGNSGDDLCGSDTTLSLGYAYNGNAIDAEYRKFGIPPPALGYDFLQGPLVAGAASDSGVFNLQRVYGKKNLPMTAFVYFSAGSSITDPTLATTYESTLKWWRMLRGYQPDVTGIPERYYPFPPGITPGPFTLTGNPVNRTGAIDGLGTTYSLSPGDRRIILCSGPFRLAPGDTQEVVVGTVAGLGADRLSSIDVMKFNDRFVQNTYNALFAVPKPPAPPDVKYAELDGHVIFEWASNPTRVRQTETVVNQPGAFAFEGYNVYQFPNANSSLKDARRLATYDLLTDPTVVLDQVFDEASGQILLKPVQYGTNSGITRYFEFSRDYVRDIPRLNDGSEYYIGITAYSVSGAGFLPVSLESTPQVFTVVPQKPKPGSHLGGGFQDTVRVTLTTAAGSSPSDGSVTPVIINPAVLTGHNYSVTFHNDSTGTTLWDMKDVTRNVVVLADQTNQTGDNEYSIVDGMLVKVAGPPVGMKSWGIPSGARKFSPVGGFTGLGLEGFSDAGNPEAYDQDNGTIGAAGHLAFGGIGTTLTSAQYHTVLLKFANVDSSTLWNPLATPTDTNFSRAYRYLRNSGATPGDPSFVPWIIHTGTGYPYQAYDYSVPFSAWDMETTPPTRLAVGHFENNVVGGLVDGRYWPPLTSVLNSGPREFCFIFASPYSGNTPNPALQVNLSNNATTPLMWVMVCNRRNNTSWHNSDEFLITANHVNSPAHTFSFTAPTTVQFDAALAKQDVGKINVFPNPYYAFNPREISRTSRFVTFNHLPQKATIRIFNLAGQLVRTLQKDSPSQYFDWNLANNDNFPVASGMYIVHVDMPDINATKVIKVAIIQEQEVPNNF